MENFPHITILHKKMENKINNKNDIYINELKNNKTNHILHLIISLFTAGM